MSGTSGNDSIVGTSGNDELAGLEGNDSIHGLDADDTMLGGAGADVVDGGKGADTIDGGVGNEALCGRSGADTFVIRDGHGAETIRNFRKEDIIAFDMDEITGFQDVLDRMSGTDTTVLTFDNGDRVVLHNFKRADLTASNFTYSAGPVCLLEGTLIHTERGEVPIEYLRPDDIVWTKDNGWQAIRLVTFETMRFNRRDDPAKPILIPAGALGGGLPREDLITSPQQRVLRILEETGEEVLVPAVKLVGSNGIRRMRGRKSAVYLNVVLERHSIIQAAGCWVESMLVTSRSLGRHRGAARRLLDGCLGMQPARRIEKTGMRPRRRRA